MIKIDDKVLEKALIASALQLHQAYMVTKQVTSDDAKKLVAEFVSKEVLMGTLDHNPVTKYSDGIGDAKALLKEAINKMLTEYKDKQDKSYTALLRLKDMLQ